MSNINTLHGYANHMHMQALELVEKTVMLCNSAHNIMRAGAAINGHASGAFRITFDMGDNNELMAMTFGTADVIMGLHDVFDKLNEMACRVLTDAETIVGRMERRRRRRRRDLNEVTPNEEPDDDITFIMERRANNI